MKKLFAAFAIITMSIGLAGCYEQVPAGNKGKIMGASGFQPEVYPPSKIWLDQTLTTVPEKLYLVETTTRKYEQPFTVLLKDKLELTADVVFRGRIRANDEIINSIFNDMPMDDNIVTTNEVYNTYGKMIVLNTAREVISKYNVDEVNTNYARITTELYQALEPKLANLPLEISDVTIGNIQYPKIVTMAIEKAKEKRMKIEEEEAKVQIKMTELKGMEEAAKAEYRIKMMEGKRIRDFNTMTAQGITPALLRLRELELKQQEIERWDGNYPLGATTVMGGKAPVIVDATDE